MSVCLPRKFLVPRASRPMASGPARREAIRYGGANKLPNCGPSGHAWPGCGQQAQPRCCGAGGVCVGSQGCLLQGQCRLDCASRAAAAHLGASRPRADAVCVVKCRAGGAGCGGCPQGRRPEGSFLFSVGGRRYLAPAGARGRHAPGLAPAGALRGHHRRHHHLGTRRTWFANTQPQTGLIAATPAARARTRCPVRPRTRDIAGVRGVHAAVAGRQRPRTRRSCSLTTPNPG